MNQAILFSFYVVTKFFSLSYSEDFTVCRRFNSQSKKLANFTRHCPEQIVLLKEKGLKGDNGEPNHTGIMGIKGEKGEPANQKSLRNFEKRLKVRKNAKYCYIFLL